jgi:hypothetical protein
MIDDCRPLAIVRPDLIVLFIILFIIAGIFYFALGYGYPILYIGLAALIGGIAAFGYWMYKQMKGS